MKENVFDILMYLFEHYFHEPGDIDPSRSEIETELQGAGFNDDQIHKALNWIDALAENRELLPTCNPHGSMRIYTPEEASRLDAECRGFLLFLEQTGILDASHREIVIERLMALEEDFIELDKLKWVVLMVLFSRPGQEEACAWMENLLFEQPDRMTH